MRLTPFIAALSLLAGEAFGQKGIDGLQPVPFERLGDRAISRLGQTALAIRAPEWNHAETKNFVYHYFDSFIATPVSVEAEFYYRVIAGDLRRETARWERKCHIFVFQHAKDWALFQRSAALDPWTGGIHYGGELFLLRNQEQRWKGATLGHEVAHLVMHRFFGNGVPLWLDEGYAEYISVVAYASYYRARGYNAKPRTGAVPAAQFIPLDRFLMLVDYPQSRDEIEAFYLQSHRLVRFLANRGKDRLLLLFERLGDGARSEAALASVYPEIARSAGELERQFKPYALGE